MRAGRNDEARTYRQSRHCRSCRVPKLSSSTVSRDKRRLGLFNTLLGRSSVCLPSNAKARAKCKGRRGDKSDKTDTLLWWREVLVTRKIGSVGATNWRVVLGGRSSFVTKWSLIRVAGRTANQSAGPVSRCKFLRQRPRCLKDGGGTKVK